MGGSDDHEVLSRSVHKGFVRLRAAVCGSVRAPHRLRTTLIGAGLARHSISQHNWEHVSDGWVR